MAVSMGCESAMARIESNCNCDLHHCCNNVRSFNPLRGWGLNLCLCSDSGHYSWILTHCATVETPQINFLTNSFWGKIV